ncbi:MAG: hypothetical protein H6950_03755 [Zoogloeaceae bacterium]|nr:hypothetical protein [Rhodocyclaceae bacterium]MCP5231682.1 hypothetical protein [Zoogloeaceae bacterium]MCP5239977.1 hypothetical protein [Zoogloeaceae bacterium]MCP5253794.1 hypothetical protein [Zoogloeaceae bacterium]MCP5293816.1 hypothetical protein [Zoogloeaceae bacterium]
MITKLLASLSLLAVLANACAADAPALSVTGFATFGAVYTDDSEAQFIRWGVNKPSESRLDFSPDSILGVQASLPIGPKLDATVQLVSSEDPQGSYAPRVTWAFLRYVLTPSVTIRAGRMRAPFFMLSDSLLVNYANVWVRPPVEVYSLVPVNELDGIDLFYREQVLGVELEAHPYFGSSRLDLFDDSAVRLRDAVGFNLAIRFSDLTVHFGHAEAKFGYFRESASSTALARALSGRGPDGAALASQVSGDDGYARFDSLGFQWDDGRNILIGEYAKRRTNRYIASVEGAYLSIGRRLGAFTPYVSYAVQNTLEDTLRGTPPPGFEPSIGLFNVVRDNAQRSITLGTRWDLNRTFALKAELSRFKLDDRAAGSFYPKTEAAAMHIGGRSFNTLSISLDVLF